MKTLKKTLAILLAVMMLVGVMTVSALAADQTFRSYQIFSGDQEGDGPLSNIKWGNGIDGAALLADLKQSSSLYANANTAIDVAKILSENPGDAENFAKIASQHLAGNGAAFVNGETVLEAGYYLVVDETGDENGTRNLAVLEMSHPGTAEIEIKASSPEVEKKVMDKNDTTGETSGWQDSADYDIGDTVPFQITATLGKIDKFDSYKLIFHDTLSSGLTLKENSVVVTVDGQRVRGFDVSYEGTNLTIGCEDVKSMLRAYVGSSRVAAGSNSVIVVTYDATLNEGAVLGSAGNPNTVKLEFSSNPNVGGEGETKETPEDKVIVFTYGVVINKVDEQDAPLAGAAFKLSKKNANGVYETIKEIGPAENLTEFLWKGLDDGDYKLEETKTPAGYNSVDPVEFTIAATHDEEAADPALLTLTCTKADGSADVGLEAAIATGMISGKVVNVAGATLPETGGAGTTMIYVMGSIMLLGGCVMLVTKRRMGR